MRTVYKYLFGSSQQLLSTNAAEIEMPAGAQILSVQMQAVDGPYLKPYLWALVDTTQPLVKRRFEFVLTGEPVGDGWIYLATVVFTDGSIQDPQTGFKYWMHVFERV